MAATPPAVIFDVADGIARITLNRPDAGNALDEEMAQGLLDAARSCEARHVRAVLITGAGRNFSVGGDLRGFNAALETDTLPDLLGRILGPAHQAIEVLAGLRAPVVAAVQGAAAGFGMSLATSVDLVVAAEEASFTLAYTAIGLTPDGSSSFFLPRLLGSRRALELALLNTRLDAATALEWGLVNRVVARDALEGEAAAVAERLAQGPTDALAATKALIRSSDHATLHDQLAAEQRAIQDAARSADAREGIAAFLAKRAPAYTRE